MKRKKKKAETLIFFLYPHINGDHILFHYGVKYFKTLVWCWSKDTEAKDKYDSFGVLIFNKYLPGWPFAHFLFGDFFQKLSLTDICWHLPSNWNDAVFWNLNKAYCWKGYRHYWLFVMEVRLRDELVFYCLLSSTEPPIPAGFSFPKSWVRGQDISSNVYLTLDIGIVL